MEAQIGELIKGLVQTSGGALVLAAVGKWLLGDWIANQKRVRELEKEALEGQITALDSLMKEIKLEVMALKDRIFHTEKTMIEGVSRLNNHSEKFVALSKAMEGFAKTTNERLTIVETKADQMIRVGKAMAARLTQKKTGSE